jgi:hypothetical protein
LASTASRQSPGELVADGRFESATPDERGDAARRLDSRLGPHLVGQEEFEPIVPETVARRRGRPTGG